MKTGVGTTQIYHGRPGRIALALDHFLSLSAAPAFAAMALYTGLDITGMQAAFCSTTLLEGHLPAMVVMYSLMSLYNLKPWLRMLFESPVGH